MLRILLVADDAVHRMAVSAALSLADMEASVTEVPDITSAQKVLSEQPVDCILVDEGPSGGDVAGVLRAVAEAATLAPVIVLAGRGDPETAVDLMKIGASDFLTKGNFSPSILARTIRRAVRLSFAEREVRAAREAAERKALRLKELVEICLRIHATSSVDDALVVSAAEARKLFDARVAIVRLNEPGEEACTHTSLSPTYASPEEVPTDELIWLDAPLLAPDSAYFGSLRVGRAPGATFGPDDEPILSQLARSAALAVRQARLYEASQKATRAREDLLAIVSHDLRNPLNTISMSAALLRQDMAPCDLPLLERIHRATRRMNRLIGDLLDASCLDAGRLQVAIRRELAATIAQEAIDAAEPIAAARGCRVVSELADGGAFVLADRDRLLQVFSNLLGNAIKFSPESGVVTVGLRRDGGSALFSVTDEGPGIDAQHADRLFDRYHKAGPASRDGAGLGLFIARGIVEAHNGCMRIEGERARGTRFVFAIPLAGHRGGENDVRAS